MKQITLILTPDTESTGKISINVTPAAAVDAFNATTGEDLPGYFGLALAAISGVLHADDMPLDEQAAKALSAATRNAFEKIESAIQEGGA